MSNEDTIREKFEAIAPTLNERQRRLWAAAEAMALEHGGIAIIQRATGIARSTIARGIDEIASGESADEALADRIRRPGAGRPSIIKSQPDILEALRTLIDPSTRGDPESPLLWTTKSTEKLTSELRRKGFEISARTVAKLLKKEGYSLQATQKQLEGTSHPDRNKQFKQIAKTTKQFQSEGNPVISVDTKKKELVGDFKNGGREWQPKGQPVRVNVHDFPSAADGKAVPYGIYDVSRNEGFVSVGTTADTAEFAVSSIDAWWEQLGKSVYPDAKKLLITADCGGSNGYRLRLWKSELQQLADKTGLTIRVAHYPPGTSKWNKIEHRLFSQISTNWRGRPLVSHQVVVDLIANTSTETGLKVFSRLDPRTYERGRKVPDDQMDAIKIHRYKFQGDWNYSIRPRK